MLICALQSAVTEALDGYDWADLARKHQQQATLAALSRQQRVKRPMNAFMVTKDTMAACCQPTSGVFH